MRFALIGDEPAGLSVARAAAAHPEHRLTRFAGGPEPHSPPFGPQVRPCRNWEELLNDAEIDAVIVAGNANECHDALRQFVHAGKAVLFAPSLVQPAEFFYELALVEAESPGSFFPLLALRGHPLVLALRDLLSEGGLGKLRHVQLDRQIAAFGPGPAPLLSQAEFAR